MRVGRVFHRQGQKCFNPVTIGGHQHRQGGVFLVTSAHAKQIPYPHYAQVFRRFGWSGFREKGQDRILQTQESFVNSHADSCGCKTFADGINPDPVAAFIRPTIFFRNDFAVLDKAKAPDMPLHT
ncbi:hypothetical protein FACS189476_05180 [Spirochaetia bacterium]|nr:hypothetical protein FACS189476_05180 [Spirochaetia bacterium]